MRESDAHPWCRIQELVRHAAQGDAKAQAHLFEEILGHLVEQFDVWAQDSEFGRWIDAILQREKQTTCGPV